MDNDKLIGQWAVFCCHYWDYAEDVGLFSATGESEWRYGLIDKIISRTEFDKIYRIQDHEAGVKYAIMVSSIFKGCIADKELLNWMRRMADGDDQSYYTKSIAQKYGDRLAYLL